MLFSINVDISLGIICKYHDIYVKKIGSLTRFTYIKTALDLK